MTAKSARPDANRAADGMMRSLAEGRVRWCFWPPNATPHRDGCGLWLGQYHGTGSEVLSDFDSEVETSPQRQTVKPPAISRSTEQDVDDESSDEETVFSKANNVGFFAALSLDDDGDNSDEE